MIQVGTILKVTDKTSVVLVTCIKVFGNAKKRIARLGDVILVSVKRINVKKSQNLKLRLRKRYNKGTLHRALVVRSKVNFCRVPGVFIRFNENSGVIVNKRVVPMSNRVFGPVIKELCIKWPFLGCVTRSII
jgi:large subunit ribosomal protein L14